MRELTRTLLICFSLLAIAHGEPDSSDVAPPLPESGLKKVDDFAKTALPSYLHVKPGAIKATPVECFSGAVDLDFMATKKVSGDGEPERFLRCLVWKPGKTDEWRVSAYAYEAGWQAPQK